MGFRMSLNRWLWRGNDKSSSPCFAPSYFEHTSSVSARIFPFFLLAHPVWFLRRYSYKHAKTTPKARSPVTKIVTFLVL